MAKLSDPKPLAREGTADAALRGVAAAVNAVLTMVIFFLLTWATALEARRRKLPGILAKLRGSLRKLRESYLRWRGLPVPTQPVRQRRASNRITAELEEEILRLHVAHPQLGAARLRAIVHRVLGRLFARETIRAVLLRNGPAIAALQNGRRKAVPRILVSGPRVLWGMDLTVVWVLGLVPIWLIGIIDYHGSRLVALEPLPWPTSERVAHALEAAFEREGAPQRILTDRGNVFGAPPVQDLLAKRGVEHARTKPHHPWTNGRIERLFRTFKETIRPCFWLVKPGEYAGICADFVELYNHHRPHLAWGNRTPAEVHRGEPCVPRSAATPVTFFEGRLVWWRFT